MQKNTSNRRSTIKTYIQRINIQKSRSKKYRMKLTRWSRFYEIRDASYLTAVLLSVLFRFVLPRFYSYLLAYCLHIPAFLILRKAVCKALSDSLHPERSAPREYADRHSRISESGDNGNEIPSVPHRVRYSVPG